MRVSGRPQSATFARLALATATATALAAACTDNQAPPGQLTKVLGPATSAQELFELRRLPKFFISIDDAGWAALEEDPKSYITGDFEYAGELHRNVGIRLKGNLSLTPIDEKPSFKIKFNKFTKGARFLGLEAITLNNMHSDASMVREHLSYALFRAVGVEASRTGFAELVVNEEPYGVFLNIETIDDEFLRHHYVDRSGNLYEGEHGDDLNRDLSRFEQDEGKDESREDLKRFSALAMEDNLDIFFADHSMLDTQRFLAFTATEHAIGHFDGYMASHNYFLYHEPESDRWTFLPWSLDQTLSRRNSPFSGKGFLTRKCLDADLCLEAYIPEAIAVLDAYATLDLPEELDKVVRLIDDASIFDSHKRYTNKAMTASRQGIKNWLAARPEALLSQLDCLESGKHVDQDADGWGPCFADCDDSKSAIHPGAEELCDKIDNNCSGFIDDDPNCECPSEVIEGKTFYFCTHRRSWSQARSFCWAQGHELAMFSSASQNHEVWEVAHASAAGKWAIGLNDSDEENQYRWLDGSEPNFTSWGTNEPSHMLDWFDCVFFKGGSAPLWIERNCVEKGSFICSEAN